MHTVGWLAPPSLFLPLFCGRPPQLGKTFLTVFDYAINNVYFLYKHDCKLHDISTKDLLDFRIELIKLFIWPVGIEVELWSLKAQVQVTARVANCAGWEKVDCAEGSAGTVSMQVDVHLAKPPLHAPAAESISAKSRFADFHQSFVCVTCIFVQFFLLLLSFMRTSCFVHPVSTIFFTYHFLYMYDLI